MLITFITPCPYPHSITSLHEKEQNKNIRRSFLCVTTRCHCITTYNLLRAVLCIIAATDRSFDCYNFGY